MNDPLHSILIIAVMAVVTALLRCLPFLIYCFKGVSFSAAPFGAPELLAGLVVVGLHIWKRNSLLSIGLGTVCYMLLIQFVF